MNESEVPEIIPIEQMIVPYGICTFVMGAALERRRRLGLWMSYVMVVVSFAFPLLMAIDSNPPSLYLWLGGVLLLSLPGFFAFRCMKFYHDRPALFTESSHGDA